MESKKLFIALLTNSKEFANNFISRNSDNYNIKAINATEVNRHQTVVFGNDIPVATLIKRLMFEQNTVSTVDYSHIPPVAHKGHKANKTSYIRMDGKVVRLTWDIVKVLQSNQRDARYIEDYTQFNHDRKVEIRQWCHQLYEFQPELESITQRDLLIDVCNGIVAELGFKFDNNNSDYIDKLSNYTATEDNEFMFRGDTTSHVERRMKQTYASADLLDAVRNACMSLYYASVGIASEADEMHDRHQATFEYFQDIDEACGTQHALQFASQYDDIEVVDVNPEWLS